MIDVYICEDNPKHLETIDNYLRNIIEREKLNMQVIVSETNPQMLLKKAQQAENIGAYFLDIDLRSDMNGLVLTQKIRQLQPRCFIVFITSHSEMSFLTFQYKVEALDFILKDQPKFIKQKLRECLLSIEEKAQAQQNILPKVFRVSLGNHLTVVELDKILYFETSSTTHRVILHTGNRQIEFPGHLKEVMVQLDEHFYRCHRSYIINTNHITAIDYEKCLIHMKNGDVCPLSIRLKKGLKNL